MTLTLSVEDWTIRDESVENDDVLVLLYDIFGNLFLDSQLRMPANVRQGK